MLESAFPVTLSAFPLNVTTAPRRAHGYWARPDARPGSTIRAKDATRCIAVVKGNVVVIKRAVDEDPPPRRHVVTSSCAYRDSAAGLGRRRARPSARSCHLCDGCRAQYPD